MPETNQIVFTWKEITTLLLKEQHIHEGLWGIVFEFGLVGAVIPFPPGSNTSNPAAIIGIQKIGIQRFEKENPLTVDAAEVNPQSPTNC
jgi:hypothetical protein